MSSFTHEIHEQSLEFQEFHVAFDGKKVVAERDVELEKIMCEYYEANGFVVISNVFTKKECEDTVTAMWNLLEDSNPKFDHNDFTTWDQFKATG